ncbi:MAG: LemA family protein [Bacteroidota bacterium]|nr:LemA family protein [Odoribacter sp.]MDP3641616.1 LemA family protein [Bacteroidota bacterium]
MKKTWIILAVIAVVIFMVVSWFFGTYNKMVSMDEGVKAQWSQVENVYQRRADLIPNLVSTVKGYADFEQETLTQVVEARAKATSVNINPEKLDAESLQNFQQAQSGLSSALGRLMVVVEKYPELKANQGFLDLQAQLEGSENRITVERMKFNESAQSYNTLIRGIPNSMIAGIGGFEKKAYFEAEKGTEKAPEVKF